MRASWNRPFSREPIKIKKKNSKQHGAQPLAGTRPLKRQESSRSLARQTRGPGPEGRGRAASRGRERSPRRLPPRVLWTDSSNRGVNRINNNNNELNRIDSSKHDKHDIFLARMRRKGFPRVIALAATMGDGARRWPPRRQRGIEDRGTTNPLDRDDGSEHGGVLSVASSLPGTAPTL